MSRIAFALVLGFAFAAPAAAQMATADPGAVGSATMRNGYPAGGGAVVLPTIAPSATGTAGNSVGTAANRTSTLTNSAPPTSGQGGPSTGGGAAIGSAGGGAGGGVRASSAASSSGAATTDSGRSASGARAGSGRGTGTNWVVCAPSGASGIAPLFTGTDLSCAPD
jgi:hypothetical protein